MGKDTATGGGGRDLYDLNAVADSKAGAATRAVITDFDHLVDRIDLSGIDADTTVAGNTIIRASTDADAASEFAIQLTGIKTLTASDFYL